MTNTLESPTHERAEGATGVPAHQAVNEVIAGGDTALTLESYVASSTDFMRGLQEVLIASAQSPRRCGPTATTRLAPRSSRSSSRSRS